MPVLMDFTKFSTITVDILEITSDTSCRNSSTDPVFISISCTVSCHHPVITLNHDNTFNLIQDEVIIKTCMNSSGTFPNCNYLQCPYPPDPAINIIMQKQ